MRFRFESAEQDLRASLKESGDRPRLVQILYNSLSQREKLLALGLGFFNDLFEDQFFTALEYVVEEVWQKRDSSLQALDYEDLLSLQGRLFQFLDTRSNNRQIELIGPDYRYLLFKAAWGSHQRQILNALPTLKKVVEGSFFRVDTALYGSLLRRQQLRTSISETISDIGLITLSAVEDILIEFASTDNYYSQDIAAHAIARWHKPSQDEPEVNQLSESTFLAILKEWNNDKSRTYSYSTVYVSSRNNSESQDANSARILAKSYLQSTLALIVGDAVEYDLSGNLSESLFDLSMELIANSSSLVRDRVSYRLLPSIISTHITQLDTTNFFQTVINQSDETLIEGLALSLGIAYQTNPDLVLSMLRRWESEVGSCPDKVNAATVGSRDAKILTIAKTYGEIQGGTFPDKLNSEKITAKIFQILRKEKHPKIREALFESIESQLLQPLNYKNVFRGILGIVQENFQAIDRKEGFRVTQLIEKAYLWERKQLENPGLIASAQGTITVDGENYYVASGYPKTEIENILSDWIVNTKYPIAQQIALQGKTHLAKIFNLEESRILSVEADQPLNNEVSVALADDINPQTIPQGGYRGEWVPRLATRKIQSLKPSIRNLLPEAIKQKENSPEAFKFVLEEWQSHTTDPLRTLMSRLGTATGTGTWWDDVLKYMIAGGAIVTLLTTGQIISAISKLKDSPSISVTQPGSVSQPGIPTPLLSGDEDLQSLGVLINSETGISDDSPSWKGAKVVAIFSDGYHPGDIIDIRISENDTLKKEGNNLKVDNIIIAQIEGGENNKPLQISFLSEVNQEQVNQILQKISYRNSERSLIEGIRDIGLRVIDNEGAESDIQKFQIYVTSENKKPTIQALLTELKIKGGDSLSLGPIQLNDSEQGEIKVTITAEHGRLVVTEQKTLTKGLKPVEISGSDSSSVQLSGSLASVQQILSQKTGVQYIADQSYSGNEPIKVVVKDQGKASKKTKDGKEIPTWKGEYLAPKTVEQLISVQVTEKKQSPKISLPAALKVRENESVTISGLSIQDADTKEVSLKLSSEGGFLTINGKVKGGISEKNITGNGTQSVIITDTIEVINLTLLSPNSLRYQHKGGDTASVSMTVNDKGKGTSQSLPIQIERKNKKPIWDLITRLQSPTPSASPSSTPQTSLQSSPAISQSEAVDVVRYFMSSIKPQIYSSSYNIELADKFTTGEYLKSVQGAINTAKSYGEYYQYTDQIVTPIGNVSGNESEVKIDLQTSETMQYIGGKDSGKTEVFTSRSEFTLRKEDNTWKIADRKKSSIPLDGE
jgi:hypothetical protein